MALDQHRKMIHSDSKDPDWTFIGLALDSAKSLRATVKRDKLYGLYGVLQVLCSNALPPPDYDLDLPIVWMHGTVGVILGFRTLDSISNTLNDGVCPVHRIRLKCSE
jgi:hypothetical protein